ncbi:hypothetical protein VTP01DRAFT_784 [Rhizomucor pusillus]|uniref:uncharacterized protein n=1 Tax=Rhizomucor pusillus TaxID=4840 RepID=UPI0037440D60
MHNFFTGTAERMWLFSFERYNGIINHIDTNQKDRFELTSMKHFLKDVFGADHTSDTLYQYTKSPTAMKIARLIYPTIFPQHEYTQGSTAGTHLAIGWEPLPPCSYSLKMGKLIYMANERYPFLVDYYNEVYKEQIQKMTTIEILGQTFISDASRHYRASPFVSVVCSHNQDRFLRPAHVLYYFKHIFAFVQYYQPSQHHWGRYEAIDVSIYNMQPAPLSKACIVPVHRLYSTVGVFPLKIDNCAAFVFLPRKVQAAC